MNQIPILLTGSKSNYQGLMNAQTDIWDIIP